MSGHSLTIRVSRSTHELLRELAAKSNTSITAVVDEAVGDLRRRSSGRTSTSRARPSKPTPQRGLISIRRTWRGSKPSLTVSKVRFSLMISSQSGKGKPSTR